MFYGKRVYLYSIKYVTQNMEQLNNPFVIYGYKGAEYFCDRQAETETVVRALHNERNMVLISPRRLGKTGLIHHAFAQIEKTEPETKCFYMDINATRNLQQFVQLFAKTVIGKIDSLSQSVIRKITSFFSSCKPTLSLDELTGVPTFSITISDDQKEESLRNILEYLKESGKRIYIAIDEFQQIAEYPEKGTEALLRSYIQFVPNVVFIFAGSKQHIMAEMFTSAKRPFYQSSQMLSLAEIDVTEYHRFANRLLAAKSLAIDEATFTYLYNMMDGQTWYIQHILNRLYERGGDFDASVIGNVVTELVNEQEVAFFNYYDSLTYNQSQLLSAIAKEKNVDSVLSHDFIVKHGLPASSSVSLALKTLLNREFVYKYNGKYIVYDRFFAIWLRKL